MPIITCGKEKKVIFNFYVYVEVKYDKEKKKMFHSVEHPAENYLVGQPFSDGDLMFDEEKEITEPFSSLDVKTLFYDDEGDHFTSVETKLTYHNDTLKMYGFFPRKYTDSPDSLNDYTEMCSLSGILTQEQFGPGLKAVFRILDKKCLNYTGVGEPLVTLYELKEIENEYGEKLGECNMCSKRTAYFTQYEDEGGSVYECLWCMNERGGVEVLGEQEQPWSIYVRDSVDEVLPNLLP